MEPKTYLAHVRADGDALAAAARSNPEAPVPTCPGWDLTGLVRHTGGVHRWVIEIVRTQASERLRYPPPPDVTGADAVLAWYEDGLNRLVDLLAATDPDVPVWTWGAGGPSTMIFWHRRMANETAMHRWDAERAVGSPAPIDTDLALDGIDEYLSLVGARLARAPVEELKGSLHLHATDAEGEWWLGLAPDRIEARHEHAKADAALRGSASDLLLWLLNRVPADAPGLSSFGDTSLIETWKSIRF